MTPYSPTLAIYEIIRAVADMKTDEEKVAWLKKHDSQPLRIYMRCLFDEKIQFDLPFSRPLFKTVEDDSFSVMYRDARRMRLFVKDHPHSIRLGQHKRNMLFIELLEEVHKEDAEILLDIVSKRVFNGLTRHVVAEALPGFILTEI